MSKSKVTSLEELKAIADGNIIELPGWTEDKPLIAKVKRVSLLSLVTKGQIPNSLLGAADKVFNKPNADIDMKEMGNLFDIIVGQTLVEPTLKTIQEVGLELTDQQKVAIFNFTQEGLKGLEPFRAEQTDIKDN